MSINILCEKDNSKPFSLEVRTEFFESIQDSSIKNRAIKDYLSLCEQYIRKIVNQSPWAQQWGIDDAYQYAVTYLLEQSMIAASPEQLPQYRDIQNAVAQEAAKYIYPVELSPYLIKTHGYGDHWFEAELQLSEDFEEPSIHDELMWQRIRRIAQDSLEVAEQRILALFMEKPGFIPSMEEIAQRLSLKIETAKRYVRRFKQKMRDIPGLKTLFQELELGQDESDICEPVVVEAAPVAVATEKVVSITQWKRAKIQRTSQGMKVFSLSLRRALDIRVLRESAFSLRHPSPSHPTIGLHRQCGENLLLQVLNKPLQFSIETWTEMLNVLSERVSSSRPWDDWNPDTGDCVA